MDRVLNLNDGGTFKSPFIKNFSVEENDATKIVYHYTSLEAFKSIIETKSLRFTDIYYMNDYSEQVYFVKILMDFLNENEDFPHCKKALDDLLGDDAEKYHNLEKRRFDPNPFGKQLGPTSDTRKFVFCMSQKIDSLSMWNYYLHNEKYSGVCMAIDLNGLLHTFDVEKSNELDSFMVYYGKVVYKKYLQYDLIRKMLAEVEELLKQNKSVIFARTQMYRVISTYACFFKDDHFSDEKEYRIVIEISENNIPRTKQDSNKYFGKNNKELYEEFYIRQGLIVPSINVTVPNDMIKNVRLSPTTEFQLAKNSVDELLKNNMFNNVKVMESKVPIRY